MNILDYIRGDKRGKKARKFELEAMRDPFLADAMDGFDSVKGEHTDNIEKLKKQIEERSKAPQRQSKKSWLSVAAVALVLIVGTFVILLDTDNSVQYAKSGAMDTLRAEEPLYVYMPEKPEKEKKEYSSPVQLRQSSVDRETISPQLAEDLNAADEIIAAENREEHAILSEISSEQLKLIEAQTEVAMAEYEKQSASAMAIARTPQYQIQADQSKTSSLLKGKVTDEAGEPIIGATVIIKGTNRGTVTDIDGNFYLDGVGVDENSQLIVSFIGMETVELSNPKPMQEIAMRESRQLLDEVVVVGYGTRKKSALTGAVSTVKSESETKVSIPKPIGGQRTYNKYLKENINKMIVSEDCEEEKGKVVVQFYVDVSGNPVDISVKQGLCSGFDEEAIRLVEEGPRWTLGEERVDLEIIF